MLSKKYKKISLMSVSIFFTSVTLAVLLNVYMINAQVPPPTGIFAIKSKAAPKCAEVYVDATSNGFRNNPCDKSICSQGYKVKKTGNYYRIVKHSSPDYGLAFADAGGSGVVAGKLYDSSCSDDSLWEITESTETSSDQTKTLKDRYFTIKNKASGLFLELVNCNDNDGGLISLNAEVADDKQKWSLVTIA